MDPGSPEFLYAGARRRKEDAGEVLPGLAEWRPERGAQGAARGAAAEAVGEAARPGGRGGGDGAAMRRRWRGDAARSGRAAARQRRRSSAGSREARAADGWASGAGCGLPGPWRRGDLGTGRGRMRGCHVAAVAAGFFVRRRADTSGRAERRGI